MVYGINAPVSGDGVGGKKVFSENGITIRLWFFEISIKRIPKGSFVGKRHIALFFNNKKIFKY